MVCRGSIGTSKNQKVRHASRGQLKWVALAIAAAVPVLSLASLAPAQTTYQWNALTPSTDGDYLWMTPADWTVTGTVNAAGYPGGDPTVVDDAANISLINGTTGGVVVIDLDNPLPTTLSTLTVNLQSTVGANTDGITLNINSNLTTTGAVTFIGGASSGGKYGRTIVNVGTTGNFTVGGSVTLSGADGNGSTALNINGDYSAASTTIKDDGDTITINSGTVNLGNMSVYRSVANGSITAAGLHIVGGEVTADNFLVGSGNSSGQAAVTGAANVTITGSFIVGDLLGNNTVPTRINYMYQSAGTVTATAATGLTLGASIAGSANATIGTYVLSGGTLNVPLLQMTSAGGLTGAKANFTLSGGAALNIGAGGIAVGNGSASLTSNGGIISATASWSSPVNMNLASNATTFQAADASNNAFNINLSGAISGAGSILKTGGGALTLGGGSTYSGGTTVSSGQLFVDNTATGAGVSGTGTGAVSITGATLGGTGTIQGDVTLDATSHLAPGDNDVGTLSLGGNLTLASGATLDFAFNPSANSVINLTNASSTFTVSSAGINVYNEGTTDPFETNGTYDLIQVAGALPSISGLSILNGMAGVSYTLGTSGQDITLTVTGGQGALGWAKTTGGSWATAANWNGGIPDGGVAILGNVLTAASTVTLDGSHSITGLNFNSAKGYTIAQGTGGSLIFDNGASDASINDFAGPQAISAPVTLNSTTDVSLTNSTDTITISGAISGTGNLTVAGLGTLILTNSANTYTGSTINNGNLQIGSGAAAGSFGTGTVVNNSVITFNSSSNMNIATVISGAGNITQNGTGILTLSGANTYTGVTNINNGTVQYGAATGLGAGNINVVAPGKLDLNGLSVAIANVTGNGTIDNLSSGNTTLTFNGGGFTFNGTIQNTVGNLTVVATSSGTVNLGGTNTYTGGTNLTLGQLALSSNNAAGTGTITITSTSNHTLLLGSGVVLSNPIVIDNGSVNFVDLNTAGTSATLAGPISTVGSTQYRLGTSNATSSLDMTGASTVGNAITLITDGNVVFSGNGSLINSAQAVSIGRQNATTSVNLTIQDNAVVRGVGINLGGINGSSDDSNSNVTINGNGTLDAGTGVFSLNNGDTSGNVTLQTNDNSLVRGSAFTMTGSKTGTSFWVASGGTIAATANNANFMPASSKLSVYLGGTVNIDDGGFNIGISQPLNDFGGGAINKIGNGSLSLSGNNSYGSGTTVTSGTLFADNAANTANTPLGSGGVTVNSGATLGGSGVISNSITLNNGAHFAPGDGAVTGTLALSAGLTLPSGSTLDFNFKTDGTANSLLELQSGSITNDGAAGIDLYQAGTTTPFNLNGVYNLIQFDGGFADPGLSIANPVAGVTYALSNSGNDLVLTISGGLTNAAWAIDADGSWASSSSWTGGVPNSAGSVATFGSVITAPRTVTLDGNQTVGQLLFNNANAYTINGGTGGTLTLDNGASNAQITDSNGTHFINVPVALNSNTTLTVTNAADTMNITGVISGAGSLTTAGAGSAVLGGANSFAGLFTATGSGTVTLSGANSFGGITNAGTGTVILSGANTYSGPTTITTGKIQLAAGGTLGNGSSALSIASGATLDLNGQSGAVGSLSGAGTIDNVAGAGASVLTTGSLNANATFSGVIKNTTGTVGLTKVGTGALTLSGANTYAGGTTVNAGSLYVNSTAGTGTGAVTLNGGTLGGTGTITGAVIAGSGAHTINPGSSTAGSIGTLTVGGLTTDANTALAFDLTTPTGTSDVLAVTGNVTLAGGSLVVSSQTTTGAASLGYYKVLTYSGTLTGSTSGIVLPAVANNVSYTLDTTHDAGTIDIHRGYIGDANDDGTVDLNDLNIVLNNLGTTNSSWSAGNFDGAATIDLNDLNDVLNNLGTSIASTAGAIQSVVSSPAATPEPASLALLGLGAAAMIARRRNKA